MNVRTLDQEQVTRAPLSIATYAAIIATLLIMVLSAVTFAVSPGEQAAWASYDPKVSLVGFANSD
ncbi:MAG TPA: hypothetical protein EYQ82_07340 [Dehalococcoidia bacterium]|jgi:hypothetical protein|nr:hypothetical protein [Dehalococcoidia bacterium]